jgi:hypothetical protein
VASAGVGGKAEVATFAVDELLGGVSNSSSRDRDPGEHRDTRPAHAGTTGTIRPLRVRGRRYLPAPLLSPVIFSVVVPRLTMGGSLAGLDDDELAHHAPVLVLENVAVEHVGD